MSGIAGLLSLSWPQVEPAWARRMAEAMGHRGPDRLGGHDDANGRLSMAVRMLATNNSAQNLPVPLGNPRGDVWLAFDGSICNARALRHGLELEGHVFRSDDGTEAALYAYDRFGLGFLEHLQGMFALALWDERCERLLLARDRMGQKPLYYAQIDGYLAFASEIKALLEILPRRRAIDPQALAQYLAFGYVMPPLTLFDGIRKLGPGEALIVERNGGMRRTDWWRPLRDSRRTQAVQALSHENHVTNIRTLLESAVADRISADPDPGVFLSGGVDSAAIAAIATRLLGRPVDTVTVSHAQFPGADESAYGRLAAKAIGTHHDEFALSDSEAISALPAYVEAMDEPLADPLAVNTWWAAKRLRQSGITVALSGDGADELLLGRPAHMRYMRHARAWRSFSRLPGFLRGIAPRLLDLMGRSLPPDLLDRAQRGLPMFLGSDLPFSDDERQSLLAPQMREHLADYTAAGMTDLVQREMPGWVMNDPLALVSLTETRMRLPELLLTRLDKMAQANGVEARAPFLDHVLADYALAIPGDLRAPDGKPKELLRQAMTGLLPEAIQARPRKTASSVPVSQWLRGDLGRMLEEKITSSGLFRHYVLDAGAVRRLLGQHQTQQIKAPHKLWTILLLAEWYDSFGIEGLAAAPDPANDIMPVSDGIQAAE